ncbi:DNA translocase FtsK [uncultured Slackia sp.]|uniref:FtsK/SpoIIIE family DNA translocase n=1 Tax=uncultured Slackia sp. TaxID=665903 RepID=UPI0026DEAD35|nr:DNA translocase FtsK [uncultured Slackia sp.]
MARGSKTTESQSKKKSDAAKEGRVALKDAPAKSKGRRKEAEAEAPESAAPLIFDERTKRDIAGVAIAVAAVVLFVTAVLPPSGFITSALAEALHAALGVGAYVLPVLLAAVGACFLVRGETDALAVRMSVGFAMLFVAFETLLALFVPGADADASLLFGADALRSHGGYLGAGIAWALLELLGRVVGSIVMVGLALGGAVVIGFSVSGALHTAHDAISSVKERVEHRRERREAAAAEDESDVVEAPPYRVAQASEPPARIVRRPDPIPRVPRDLSRPRRASQSLSTQVLGAPRTVQGGPSTTSVDMYWPSDYAYDEARAIADEGRAIEAKRTRVLGVEDPLDERGMVPVASEAAPSDQAFLRSDRPASAAVDSESEDVREEAPAMATRSLSARKEKPAKHVLPWEDPEEDDAPYAPQEASPVLDEPKSMPPAPMPRKLERTASASDAPVPAPTRSLKKPAAASRIASGDGETRGGFTLPAFSLIRHSEHAAEADERELAATAADLQGTLEDFNIMATVVGWVAGPTVTLFKVDLPSGVRVSRIMALQDDIALALAAPGVRIFAPIPGTNHVGIEVPNKVRQNVLLGDVIKDAKGSPLEMAIGKDVEGHSIVTDLAKMPHLLIGGTTGSGKSVAINAMIMSILMRATPDEVRFIMIDPKRVEFTPYNGIPHLYVPVVTENKEAASALAWGVAEMERRLKVMSKAGVRNIAQYNKKVEQGVFDDEADEDAEPAKKMPYIVIIIDELADLMMNVGKEVELSISRIAQLARAAGIHMIVATQRPSTNVVTGLIKANITNRIAFNVASGIDSRVILDTPGAENLIGLGDMLFSKPEYAKPQRLQGCFVSEEEIEAVVAHLKEQGEPEYHQEILQTNVIGLGSSMPDGSGGSSSSDDPLLWEAADIVVASGMGSTSNIQRRLSVGYSRAGRIMDMLEEKGIVGPPNGSKPREVLVDAMELETLKAFEAQDASEGF